VHHEQKNITAKHHPKKSQKLIAITVHLANPLFCNMAPLKFWHHLTSTMGEHYDNHASCRVLLSTITLQFCSFYHFFT